MVSKTQKLESKPEHHVNTANLTSCRWNKVQLLAYAIAAADTMSTTYNSETVRRVNFFYLESKRFLQDIFEVF